MIVLVTGLPRSGTSLMMQILQTLGLHAITDEQRRPDRHNPFGYYEHEDSKDALSLEALLSQCNDGALKVVFPHTDSLELPPKTQVVVMRRDTDAVALSQAKMMRSRGVIPPEHRQSVAMLNRVWTRSQQQLASQNTAHFIVDYEALCEDPAPQILSLCHHLGLKTPHDLLISAQKCIQRTQTKKVIDLVRHPLRLSHRP